MRMTTAARRLILDNGELRLDGIIVHLPADLEPGRDYFIRPVGDRPAAEIAVDADLNGVLGGFHFAPGGNATGRSGGDDVPAINPRSLWDIGFRPSCPDPRGMAYIADAPAPCWADIYLLGTDPHRTGTSCHGVTIADGRDLPIGAGGKRVKAFDYATAMSIYADFGKQLLGLEEFFAAAHGVTERTSVGHDPKVTGLDAARTSRYGLMQATGNMMIWGHDGDTDSALRRAALLGGRWNVGGWAGSRRAAVAYWPDASREWLGARGRSDHLQPVA